MYLEHWLAWGRASRVSLISWLELWLAWEHVFSYVLDFMAGALADMGVRVLCERRSLCVSG